MKISGDTLQVLIDVGDLEAEEVLFELTSDNLFWARGCGFYEVIDSYTRRRPITIQEFLQFDW